jgi:hypothetical protein
MKTNVSIKVRENWPGVRTCGITAKVMNESPDESKRK